MADDDIKKILVLDDDADYRKLLVVHLAKMLEGAEVEEYDPSDKGLPGDDFDWSRYDILLLDYNLDMPGVTGLDLLQANRRNLQFPATIMLTGAGNEEVAVRALKAGVYDYLSKEKLGKARLRNAILEAHDKHRKETERQNELTAHSHAFNKALFYQALEKHLTESDEKNRALLLISLDNHESIENSAGLIIRDNIVRHFAKASFKSFQTKHTHPSITRFSDISAALLIDDPATRNNLEFSLKSLCEYLEKNPYRYQDREFPFTVSIGAVRLHEHSGNAEEVIRDARGACRKAEQQEGNSYYIYTDEEVLPSPDELRQSAEPGSGEKPAAPVTPAAGAEAPAATPEAGEPDRGEAAAPAVESPKPAAAEPPEPAAAEPPAATGAGKEQAAAAAPAPAKTAAEEQAEAAKLLKKAFDEKRVIQTFRPAIPLFSEEEQDGGEVYSLSLKVIDTDGSVAGADEILRETESPQFRKFIDRWMLRESIGRIVNSEPGQYMFLLKLSRGSLADPGLFNWLRSLLGAFENRRPGESIALEIAADDFTALQKPASALISYLGKSHGFKFVLGDINEKHDVSGITAKTAFDLIRAGSTVLQDIAARPAGGDAGETLVNALKSKGLDIIADKVEDAETLTTVISLGADYAMGDFLGEPLDQLEDRTNIESFEIV